jgi:type VI secretion system protein ImpJ
MKHLSRLVWSEGMHLGPHHFQAQSRYFEDSVHFALSNLCFAPYGLGGCDLDREALSNGTLSLIHARGIFPDGLVFHMPDADPLPEPRRIAELFSPVRDRMTVYLAIPPRTAGGINCTLDDNKADGVRFRAETVRLPDENTGRDEKLVRVGRKNIRLLLDSEIPDGYVTLPLACVMRDGSGHFVFDPGFIPPVLDISASEPLMTMLRRLVEILEEKSSTLTQAKAGEARSAAGWSSREIASFWFLHCVNSALAPLRHLCFARRGHPEQLFSVMAELGGALCTFALESHPRALPLYDHNSLQECFAAMDHHIRTHLETVMPTNCLPIPLTRAADYFWSGAVTDQRCLGGSKWIFAIRSPIGEAELIERTPRLIKICSKDFVPKLVQRALPGLALTHMQLPPAAVSPRLETQYFAVNKSGPCWDHIVLTRQVGVYVPGEIPQPEIELLVVLES